MLGSGPDDGDVIEMGPEKPRRSWVIGRRSRLVLAVAGVCALLAVGGTLVGLRLDAHGPTDPALAKLVTEVTTVPVSTLEAVGNPESPSYSSSSSSSAAYSSSISIVASTGAILGQPAAASGPPLTADGRPEVLYVATEYCPYCVAESWALIVALSRFGRFSGLSTSRSPYFEDVQPVDGWTFYGSSYTSHYLAFVPVETHSNVLVNPKADPGNRKSYRALQPLTPAELAVFTRLDAASETPFFDFGGRQTEVGAAVVPSVLAGLTWSQIAADLRHPTTPVAGTILTAANILTSELCRLTGDRPAAACPQWVR